MQDYVPGDVILHEEPFFEADVKSPKGLAVAVCKFLALPAASREVLLALHARECMSFETTDPANGLQGPPIDSKEDMLQHVVRSGARLPSDPTAHDDVWRFLRVLTANACDHQNGSALYPWISRSNHSCEPNCARASLLDGHMALVCVRPIHAGEEICISYVLEQTLRKPTSERRLQLRSKFGFDCWCPLYMNIEEPLRAFVCCMCPTNYDSVSSRCNGRMHVSNSSVVAAEETIGACNVCGSVPDSENMREMLDAEQALMDECRELELEMRSHSNVASNGSMKGSNDWRTPFHHRLGIALERASKSLSCAHWICESLHNLGYVLAFAGSETCAHQEARLRFLDAHVGDRASLRRGVERAKLAEALHLQSRFAEAVEACCQALAELRVVTAVERSAPLDDCTSPAKAAATPCDMVRRQLRMHVAADRSRRTSQGS